MDVSYDSHAKITRVETAELHVVQASPLCLMNLTDELRS
jgi:hypothetical protein